MPLSPTAAGVDRRGYPYVTRAEAHALVQASQALYAIADRLRVDMYVGVAWQVRVASIICERASVSREALTALLIAAKVHGESEQADAALERV